MRFALGLLTGLAAFAAYLGYQHWSASRDPCAGHCGEDTRCENRRCVATRSGQGPGKKGKRRARRLRRRARLASGHDIADEPPLKAPSPAQLRPLTKGPGLRDPEVIDLASADGAELSATAIERRFRTLDRPIVRCIERAREGYAVEGRVAISFRIERSGAVAKWRLTAPALLVQRGLHACIDPLVRGLRFPSSARAVIMTYPYRID